MSTAPTPAPKPKTPEEIRIIAHSSLFYWWPVWFFGMLFGLWSLIEDSRIAILPSGTQIEQVNERYQVKFPNEISPILKEFETQEDGTLVPKLRSTSRVWMGAVYLLIVLLVIFITNVPLRGLWSIVVIIFLVMLALIFTLLGWWDDIFRKFGNLHVYINMGGYFFISVPLFIIWFVAVNFFDKRTYMLFTRGQVRVCEEIGGREKTYDTIGMTIEKHRDDLFRHWVLGGGSGDLTVRTSGADNHTINMPNVLWIGWRLPKIEALLRERPMATNGPASM